jgi:Uma2 family endonuclease
VVSKTGLDDRSDKFQAYWTLDTFKEYILVDQYRLRVEYFRRESEKLWELLVFTQPDDILTLKSVGVMMSLAQIYHQV